MTTTHTRRLITAITTVTVSFGALAPVAMASDGGVSASGGCSGSANWTLKAKADNGRIEVEFEVDANRAGQQWSVDLRDNGVLVYRGTRTTMAPSGSFSVDRRIANRAGNDVISGKATRTATGEVCSARVTFAG